jgi:hypothetical protein
VPASAGGVHPAVEEKQQAHNEDRAHNRGTGGGYLFRFSLIAVFAAKSIAQLREVLKSSRIMGQLKSLLDLLGMLWGTK